MSNVSQWSTSAGGNTSASPDGAPEGMNRADVNDVMREMMAAVARFYSDTDGTLVSAGSANTYTLTTNNAHAALADQSLLVFRVNTGNTGACTLAVDGLAARSWTKLGGTALATGDLVANQLAIVIYNANNTRYELLSPVPFIDLNALTTETTIATGDLVPIVDVSESNASNKITTANFLKIINALTAETSIDMDADFLPLYDASTSVVDKVTPEVLNNLVVIQKQTASNSANLIFTLDTTNYKYFELELRGVLPATDGSDLKLRLRRSGQGSADSGTSDYSRIVRGINDAGAVITDVDSTSDRIGITATNAAAGVDNAESGVSGTVCIHDAAASRRTRVIGEASYLYEGGANNARVECTGLHKFDSALDQVQVFFSPGNISSGDVILSGLRDPR